MQELDEDDFAKQGFRGKTAEGWIRIAHDAHAEWFSLVEEMNTVLMVGVERLSVGLQYVRTAPSLGCRMMMRAMGSYQGALLLVERGMVVEARTLVRNIVEVAICLRALQRDPQHFLDGLIEDSEASAFRTALTLLRLDEVSPELKVDARKAKQVHKGRAPLDFRNLSERGDARAIYLIYQRLSHTAAHTTLQSLEHFIDYDENDNPMGLRWGSGSPEDVEGVLRLLALAAFASWETLVVICGKPAMLGGLIPYRNRAYTLLGEPIPDDAPEPDPAT